MENRSIPVIGILKNLEVKIANFLKGAYKVDVTIVDVPPNYDMILSRQWSIVAGGSVQIDLSYSTIPMNGKEIRLEKEPRSNTIIEKLDLNCMKKFFDVDMGNFRVESIPPSLQLVDPVIIEIQENQEGIWKMYFDGTCSKEGSGACVVFIAPCGKTFKYSFHLLFECTNNVAEYEVLLLGLNLAIKHEIKRLVVIEDSKLVISQIRSFYSSQNSRLKQYRSDFWDSLELFDAFNIKWVERSKNIMVDFLANVALKGNPITLVGIYKVEVKTRPSIPNNIYSWQVFNDDDDFL